MSPGTTRTWRTWRARPAIKGVALVAAAVTAAAGGADVALAARPAHQLVPASSKPGLGWSIAEYSAASLPMLRHPSKGKTTLYKVNPQGRKSAFYTWPASRYNESTFHVVDWSGDGQRVLVENFFKYEQIGVTTGKVINTFKLPVDSVIGYTRPKGLNVLANVNGSIRRYDLTGKLTKVLAKRRAIGAIESPDGLTVIIGTSYGIEQVSNLGPVIRRFHVSGSSCDPVRWWNATTVLGSCIEKHGVLASRLWLFSVNNGKVTALTAQRNGKGFDLGDVNAYKLTSGLYLHAIGACGVNYIAKQSRNGSVHMVTPPGVNYPSFAIVTGLRSSLLVHATTDGCPGSSSLVWFNPGTKKVTWVLRAPNNVVGVDSVVPFGRPLA